MKELARWLLAVMILAVGRLVQVATVLAVLVYLMPLLGSSTFLILAFVLACSAPWNGRN